MSDDKVKNYRKTALQPMRPYVPGEDLTGISISEEDTSELGGMIAIGTDDGARWYVSKEFFSANYVEESPQLSFFDRMVHEQMELREKLDKLVAFFDTDTFKGLGEVDRELLQSQGDAMLAYLAVLNHRVSLYTPCNSG